MLCQKLKILGRLFFGLETRGFLFTYPRWRSGGRAVVFPFEVRGGVQRLAFISHRRSPVLPIAVQAGKPLTQKYKNVGMDGGDSVAPGLQVVSIIAQRQLGSCVEDGCFRRGLCMLSSNITLCNLRVLFCAPSSSN